MFTPLFCFHLRDIGMHLMTLKKIYAPDGKVFICMGAEHTIGMMNILNTMGIYYLQVFPHGWQLPDDRVVADLSTSDATVTQALKSTLIDAAQMTDLHLPEENKELCKRKLAEFCITLKACYSKSALKYGLSLNI